MNYKVEQYPPSGNNEMFDIPAAEEEVTVGSNEPTSTFQPQQTTAESLASAPATQFRATNIIRKPKVIMLQRSNNSSTPTSQQTPGMKAVKIITVPGQGAGGKPIKAAVIPMHLLNKGMKVISSTGQQKNIGTGLNALTSNPQLGGAPRILTLRTNNNQFNQSHMPMDGMDSNMVDLGGHQHMHSGGQLLELAAGAPSSPQVKEEMQDIDVNINQPLKTNGLRRYARCVCNKVKEKGVTSYSEVADELVHEYAAEHPMIPSEQLHYIQKNIRRRVYDALNVLMALNVLQKEKKEIHWVGLPVNMIEECRRLEEEREKRQISLRNKTNDIQDLILQLIAFKNLIVRNRLNERYHQRAQPNSKHTAGMKRPSSNLDPFDFDNKLIGSGIQGDRIHLPFLVIATNKKTVVETTISEDKLQYMFTFDQAFEIRDDVDILKRMGLTLRLGTPQCLQEEFNQCLELVPPSMRFYVEAINARRQAIVPDFEALHQQRRLFVEARLAAAATEMQDSGTGSAISTGGAPQYETKQIHFQQRNVQSSNPGGVSGSQQDLVPGDTQHYARTAASRGYVVPGGPGGALRHRQGIGLDEDEHHLMSGQLKLDESHASVLVNAGASGSHMGGQGVVSGAGGELEYRPRGGGSGQPSHRQMTHLVQDPYVDDEGEDLAPVDNDDIVEEEIDDDDDDQELEDVDDAY